MSGIFKHLHFEHTELFKRVFNNLEMAVTCSLVYFILFLLAFCVTLPCTSLDRYDYFQEAIHFVLAVYKHALAVFLQD